MKTRIHISLQVGDLDKSIAFYTRLFGEGPSKVKSDYANWRLDEPGLHLALVHNASAPTKETHEHFGVELFDEAELTNWQGRAAEAGLALRTEEQVTCCYAVADKFWAEDPDGNEWEFWVRSGEADSMKADAMPMATQADASPDAAEPCCE